MVKVKLGRHYCRRCGGLLELAVNERGKYVAYCKGCDNYYFVDYEPD